MSIPPVSVVTEPPKKTPAGPVPVRLTDPALIGKDPKAVLVPEKVAVKGPPLVAVTDPPRTMLVAWTVTPAAVFVLIFPLDWTVPPVSVIFREAAVMPVPVKFLQLKTVSAPMRVVPPTAAERRMSPVPAVRFKSKAPLIVLEKVMSPAPAPVESEAMPVSVTAFAKEIFVFDVRSVPASETAPPPL